MLNMTEVNKNRCRYNFCSGAICSKIIKINDTTFRENATTEYESLLIQNGNDPCWENATVIR